MISRGRFDGVFFQGTTRHVDRDERARLVLTSPTLPVSFGLGGKLDGKVIPLHVNAGDMGGDEFLVVE